MNHEIRAVVAALLINSGGVAYASEEPKLRFEIFVPDATPEQLETHVVNVVEAQLKGRPGIVRIESAAAPSQVTFRFTFDLPPRCSEVEAITSIIERERPQRSTRPVRYF